MKRVILLRHGEKGQGNQKEMLSWAGMKRARESGQDMMFGGVGGFDLYVVSEAFRTIQTLAALAVGAEWVVQTLKIMDLWGATPYEWKCAVEKAGGSKELADLRSSNPGFFSVTSLRLSLTFWEIRGFVEEEGSVLFIGHSPTTEMLVLSLTGKEIIPLGECEGVELEVEGKVVQIVREI